MKQKLLKPIIVTLMLCSFSSLVYASEVTGTLSSDPNAYNNSNANSTNSSIPSTATTPAAAPGGSLSGTVIGGVNVPDNSVSTVANGMSWVWIALIVLILLGGIMYAYNRRRAMR